MSREFPLARSEGLITEELDRELLVYDRESNMAHALRAEAAALWRACDGHTDVHTLAARYDLSEDKARDTLARLGELGLLEVAQADEDGDTRRAALRKIAIAAAGVASVSAISSILVPRAAAAGSCVPTGNCTEFAASCCTGQATAIGLPDECALPYGPGYVCCPPQGACAVPHRSGLLCCSGTPTPDSSCPIGYRCT